MTGHKTHPAFGLRPQALLPAIAGRGRLWRDFPSRVASGSLLNSLPKVPTHRHFGAEMIEPDGSIATGTVALQRRVQRYCGTPPCDSREGTGGGFSPGVVALLVFGGDSSFHPDSRDSTQNDTQPPLSPFAMTPLPNNEYTNIRITIPPIQRFNHSTNKPITLSTTSRYVPDKSGHPRTDADRLGVNRPPPGTPRPWS